MRCRRPLAQDQAHGGHDISHIYHSEMATLWGDPVFEVLILCLAQSQQGLYSMPLHNTRDWWGPLLQKASDSFAGIEKITATLL
jgi:hypothetical protein